MAEEKKVPISANPPGEAHPLDVVEQLAADQEWNFERPEDDEIVLVVNGKWADYTATITWMDDIETLHFACAFEFKPNPTRRLEIEKLVANINRLLWVGHFDLYDEEKLITYRHAHVCTGGSIVPDQCQRVVDWSRDMCERYFPAFQYVQWAGQSAQQALEAAEFETVGEA